MNYSIKFHFFSLQTSLVKSVWQVNGNYNLNRSLLPTTIINERNWDPGSPQLISIETKDINYIFTKKSDAADSWHENPLECVLDGQNVARNITSA